MLEARRRMTWEFTCQPCEWEVASSFSSNFSTITSENLFLYSQSQHLYIEPWGYHCHPSQGWTQGDGGPRLSSLCTYRGAGGIPSGPKSRLRSSSPKLKNSPRNFQCIPQLSIHQISYISYHILYGMIETCHSLCKFTTEKQPKCLNICQHHPDNLWSHISHSSRGLGSGESNLLSCRPTGSIFSDWRIGKAWWHTENKSFQWCLFQRKIMFKKNWRKMTSSMNLRQVWIFKTLAGNCKFGKDFLAKTTFLGWRDLTSLCNSPKAKAIFKISSCSSLLLYRRPAVIFQETLSHHLRFTQHFHLSKHISIHQPRAPWTVLASLSVSALGSRWHRPWRVENAQLAGGGRGVFFSRWSSKCCGRFFLSKVEESQTVFNDRQKKKRPFSLRHPIFLLVSFWHQAYHSSNLGLTDDFVRFGINGLNTWDRVENWGNPVGREGRVCLDYKLRSCALPETPWEPISSPHEGRDQQT